MKLLITLALPLLWLVCSSVQAQQEAAEMAKPYQKFGDYTVHFSLFSSKFLTPATAKATGFSRAEDRALLNISLVKGTDLSGSPATVVGHYKNLLQQQRSLEFKTIKEPNASYYIAPLRFTSEEILHFSIEVKPLDSEKSFTVNFTRKMYKDK